MRSFWIIRWDQQGKEDDKTGSHDAPGCLPSTPQAVSLANSVFWTCKENNSILVVQWSNRPWAKMPSSSLSGSSMQHSRGRMKLGKTPQLRIRGICVRQPSRREKRPALNFASTYPSFTSPKFLTFVIICLIIAHQPKLIINRVWDVHSAARYEQLWLTVPCSDDSAVFSFHFWRLSGLHVVPFKGCLGGSCILRCAYEREMNFSVLKCCKMGLCKKTACGYWKGENILSRQCDFLFTK